MQQDELHLVDIISAETGIPSKSIASTIKLLDDGKTIPFIARYRKELTNSLDEQQIQEIQKRIQYLRHLEERKATILKTISEQGKLTLELRQKIVNCNRLTELEDLYLPYKPKRKTRASRAREMGLSPLAELIKAQNIEKGNPEDYALQFVKEKGPSTPEEALQGARDIIAEELAEDAELRKRLRSLLQNKGTIHTQVKNGKGRSDYEMYYDYRGAIRDIPAHRVLAINRAERKGYIQVKIEEPDETFLQKIKQERIRNRKSIFTSELEEALEDGYRRLLYPSIERDVRKELTLRADSEAIKVFSSNLRQLLLQRPVRDKIILGIDPGYRTGCKLAVIDTTGKFLESATIYPHEPQKKWREALATLRGLIHKHGVELIAIGNGTASRETSELVAELIKEENLNVQFAVVNEAGASVYSASEIAREEFPELEASDRGSISIARRLQSPLAELVKIDPRSIGVGMYQYDVNQKELSEALRQVVEFCVNQVGVNLNTASISLLKYVSGLNLSTARAIVEYRNLHGAFKNRQELLNVPGIGETTFELSAGFLRIPNSENPFDNTAIHPESYQITEKLLEKYDIPLSNPSRWKSIVHKIKPEKDLPLISRELNVGLPTLKDILESLQKPGLDPRDELPPPLFRKNVLDITDLKPGMTLKGVITNVVPFGAFVDIGLKKSGLIHLSKLSKGFVKDPLDVVYVGQVVEVKVTNIDQELYRIGLRLL